MDETPWLDETEAMAWRGHVVMSKLLATQLERDLVGDSGLSVADYEVLVHLSEDPARRVRMTELAERMSWSKSRLSHQVRRMEVRGMVRREDCSSDARGTFLELTPAGLEAIQAAAPGHVAAVRKHFLSLMDDDELRAFGAAAEKVVAHLAQELGVSPPCWESIRRSARDPQDASAASEEVRPPSSKG